jgi:hypothetical protein
MQLDACFYSTVKRVIPHAKREQNGNEKEEEEPHGEWLTDAYVERERERERERGSK